MSNKSNTSDKIKRLTKYLDGIKLKLSSPTPDKHKHRPSQYKEYLEKEKRMTEKAISSLLVSS